MSRVPPLRKAVIPAAGRGTRLRPLTLTTPKEMLPVGGRPLIFYALREALLAGVEEICVVVDPKKEPLCRYLMEGDWRGGRQRGPRLVMVEQPEPLGSGDALWRAREFVADEPFAWMMPDFILLDGPPPLQQMLRTFSREGTNTVGLIPILPGREGLYGNVGLVEGENLPGNLFLVTGLSGKAPGSLPPVQGQSYKAVGRWVLWPSIFGLLLKSKAEGEWDDTPALQALCRTERVLGVVLKGKGFDVGNPSGYRALSQESP